MVCNVIITLHGGGGLLVELRKVPHKGTPPFPSLNFLLVWLYVWRAHTLLPMGLEEFYIPPPQPLSLFKIEKKYKKMSSLSLSFLVLGFWAHTSLRHQLGLTHLNPKNMLNRQVSGCYNVLQ